jgi:hypothetical protein
VVLETEQFRHFHIPAIEAAEPETIEQGAEADLAHGVIDLDQSGPATAAESPVPLGDEEVMAGDYSILAAPRIGLPAFLNVLQQAGSPAAPDGIAIYNAFVAKGVDPAVGLAIFQHESNYGKSGVAAVTNSIGNSRYYGDPGGLGITKHSTGTNGSFAAYPNYTVAAEDLARLLSSSLYGTSADHSTVRTFAAKYAPSKDHNNPAGYGASVANHIAAWTGNAGTAFAGSAPLDAHQLHVAHLATLAAHGKATGAGMSGSVAAGATAAKATITTAVGSNGRLLLLIGGGVMLVLVVVLLMRTKPAAKAAAKGEDE